MKKLLLLSLLVLAGCSWSSQQPAQPPVTVKIENSTAPMPAANDTQTTVKSQTQATTYAAAPTYTIQDDYFGPAYGTVTEVQYVQQPAMAYETQTYTEQYQTQPTYTGVPQPMYAPSAPQNMASSQNAPAGMQNQNINPYYPYAQTNQNTGVQNNMGAGSVVVLQHPMTRELVRCDFTDYNCIGSYESQGFVQLRAAPHFAGYNDVPSNTDYPPRRYRDNNNIPRW